MKRIIIFLSLLALLSVALVAADVFHVRGPADQFVDLDGNFSDANDVSFFTATVQAAAGRNISNVSLFTNISGSWERNETANATFDDLQGSGSRDVQITLKSNFTDGFYFTWAMEIVTNHTDNTINSTTLTSNRSVRVEYPPTVTVNSPVATANVSGSFTTVNFTASTVWDPDVTTLTCDVYANDTASTQMAFKGRSFPANGSDNLSDISLSEHQDVNVGVQCFETDQSDVFVWSSNVTINVDKTVPTAAQVQTNFSGNIDVDGTARVSWPITDAHIDECTLWSNATGVWHHNTTVVNLDNGGLANITHANQVLPQGGYIVGGYCWDFGGNNLTLSNYTFGVDTDAPVISNVENLSADDFLTMQINFSTDEDSTATVTFGNTSTDLSTSATSALVNGTQHFINITVEEGVEYFYNLSVCDRAGNCNNSHQQYTLAPQSAIYAGWNAYTVFDNTLDMGAIYNDSGADFVYWWNNSGQSWISHSGGVGTNAEFAIHGGYVVWLFKNTNGTWSRNVETGNIPFEVNVSMGGNFVGAQLSYNFTNLSDSFKNSTDGFLTETDMDISEVEFYSYYNNSDQRYVSYFRNESFNNLTGIRYGDAVFVGTPLNFTWNGTGIVRNILIGEK